MSDTDSFIDEVTEEVRRDRLFATLKRWGWVAGLAVLLVVGGASYNEWRKASERSAAQAFGDALLAGIDSDDAGSTLLGVAANGDAQAAIAGHLAAADAIVAGESDLGAQALSQVEAAGDAPAIYRDLAAFKKALALPPETSADDRIAAFDALSAPGAPFRVLAQEQKALAMIGAGETDGAIDLLRSLITEANVTPGLQQRAAELIVALGGDVSPASETVQDGG